MRRSRGWLGVLFFVLAFAGAARGTVASGDGAVVELTDRAPVYYLRDAMRGIVDPGGILTVREAAANTHYALLSRFGDPHVAYWLRFTYRAAAARHRWYLFAGYKPTTADLYWRSPSGTWSTARSGSAVAYRDRSVRAGGMIAFELPPASEPRTMYLRVTTNEARLTFAIDDETIFWHTDTFNTLMIVGLECVLATLFLSACLLFPITRSKSYALYAFYLLTEMVSRATDIGFANAVLWPDAAVSTLQLSVVFDGIRVCAATLFVRSFLRTDRHSRTADRLLLAVCVIGVLYSLAGAVGVPIRVSWAWTFALFYVPVWLGAAILAWRRGEERAPLIIAAWAALMVFDALFALAQFGLGRGDYVREIVISHGAYFGVAVQCVLLSLALSIDLRALTRQKARYERLAAVDALTGIPNRRAFDDALSREWERAAREGRPVSMIMLDVDRFKAYNDRYGHAQGDVALRAIAATGAHAMRAGDVFCRYGGEEFAAILPGSDTVSGARVAERLRDAIAALGMPHADSESGFVTGSLGVATLQPTGELTTADLRDRADSAMYAAKLQGRNRVEVSAVVPVG